VARSPRPEEWAPDVPRRQVVIPTEPLPRPPAPVPEPIRPPEPVGVEPGAWEPEPAAARPAARPSPMPVEVEPEPPQPGAVEVDEASGIARIDSRRMWHAPDAPLPRATFQGDVSRARDAVPASLAPRPRRTEPLRAR